MQYVIEFVDGTSITIKDRRELDVLTSALTTSGYVMTLLAGYVQNNRVTVLKGAVRYIRALDEN